MLVVCNFEFSFVHALYSTGGIALYTLEARKPVRVLQSHSVITNPDEVDSGFFKVGISCVGDGSSAVGQWRRPDGSVISSNFFAPTYQRDGRLLVSSLRRGYSNGNYKCRIGEEEAVIGLYFTSGSLVGEWTNECKYFYWYVIHFMVSPVLPVIYVHSKDNT